MKIYIPDESDNKKITKFLNKVFHKPFHKLIPSLYGKDKNTMKYHFAVEKEGALVGAICAYPEDITINGVTINGLGVGMVATSKKARNQGIMSKMLNHSFEQYAESADVSFLTGRRHRYERFGYYPAGANYQYNISAKSIQRWENSNRYTIELAETEDDFKTVDMLSETKNMVVSHPLATESETLRNWYSKLYLIKQDGNVVGYASGKFFSTYDLECMYIKDGSVEDYIQATRVYREYKKTPLLRVQVLPTEKVFKEAMSRCSEEYSIVAHGKFKVLSYKRLIEKLIAITLADNKDLSYHGVIDIEGRERLKISIEDGCYEVASTDDEPTISISEMNAISSLLGQEESIIPGLQKIALRHSDFI